MTDAELIQNHIAKKGVTQCPPAAAAPTTASPKSNATPKAKTAAKKANAKSTKTTKPAERAKKATKRAGAKREIPSGHFSVAKLADELKMTGKAARAILRRKMAKPSNGWVFANAERAKIKKMLTGAAK